MKLSPGTKAMLSVLITIAAAGQFDTVTAPLMPAVAHHPHAALLVSVIVAIMGLLKNPKVVEAVDAALDVDEAASKPRSTVSGLIIFCTAAALAFTILG